jgi:hypothetical protein
MAHSFLLPIDRTVDVTKMTDIDFVDLVLNETGNT